MTDARGRQWGLHTVATSRLRLRPLAADDRDAYVALYGDPAVMRHVGPALTRDAAGRAFARVQAQIAQSPAAAAYWMLHAGSFSPVLGLAALVFDTDRPQAELGLLLHAAQQRRGVATEAIAGLLDHVFARGGLGSVWTRHAPDHAAALRLMQGLGFAPDGERDGRMIWRVSRTAWHASNGQAAGFASAGDAS